MVYHYIDTSSGEEMDPSADTYSVMDLAREHQKRYVFRSSAGLIVLRHLPLRMKRIIDSVTSIIFPSSAELGKRVTELAQGLIGVPEENIPPEALQEFNKASAELRMVAQYYALGVIEEPRCATMDDIDEIYERITEQERDALDMLIQELARVRSIEEIDATAQVIADRYHVQIIDREMLEQMTVSQAQFFLKSIERENADIKRMMEGKK